MQEEYPLDEKDSNKILIKSLGIKILQDTFIDDF